MPSAFCATHSSQSESRGLGYCVFFSGPSLLFPILPRWEASTAEHITGENKHTPNGKHVCGRWNDLPRMNGMKYRPMSRRAPITAVRTRRGGETADPRQTHSFNAHTYTHKYAQVANMALLERIHAEAGVWQWHLHSLFNSSSLHNIHGWTHTDTHAQIHTHRARGHGRRSSAGT